MRGYDKIEEYDGILLDLPFYEGLGAITRDQAKPHHQDVKLINSPLWDRTEFGDEAFGLGYGLGFNSRGGPSVLTLNGANEYLELGNADCVDLDFIASDYSVGIWMKWTTGVDSQIVIGRYQVDVSGWEIYLYSSPNLYLTQRHHHAGGAAVRSGCYSGPWAKDVWHFLGISRTGASSIHYQNGVPLVVTGALEDPETCARDLVIGIRFSKDANWFKGSLWRPRIWDRALPVEDWLAIFEAERDFFGV